MRSNDNKCRHILHNCFITGSSVIYHIVKHSDLLDYTKIMDSAEKLWLNSLLKSGIQPSDGMTNKGNYVIENK